MSENLTNQLPPNAVKQILATLTAIDGRLTRLEERLTRLEDRVEQRSYDTRPMWDKVLVRLDGLEEQARLTTSRLEKLEVDLASFKAEIDAKLEDVRLHMRAGFKRLERQMEHIAGHLVAVGTGPKRFGTHNG